MIARRLIWLALSFTMAAALVSLWHLSAASGWVSRVFLPLPQAAWHSLAINIFNGELTDRFAQTVGHMLAGWLLASLLGVFLGAIIGISSLARAYLVPMLEFLRPLPASAVIPLAIALIGLNDSMTLAVIAFGALWPMLLATVQGFSSVEPRLFEVGRVLGMRKSAVIWKVALPHSMPDILAGLRIGMTVALILAVTCEMMTGSSGLGNWVLLAARSFRAPDLFAGVILLGVLGYLSASMLGLVENRLLRWRALSR